MQFTRYGRRVLVAVQLCVLALLGGLLIPPVASATQTSAGAADKIAPELRERFSTSSTTDFWIRFTGQADTVDARGVDDWAERGQQVVDALRQTATRSQADVRRTLDARGVSYQSFWVTNAILVSDASLATAQELAGRAEVAEIRAPQQYERPEPVEVPAPASTIGPDAVEWGVANINADDVWAEHGVRGEGIVVANIDTGVQYDHPALVNQYRGNNGDGTFSHDYNWFDVAGACPDGPCETDPRSSHGTHTMGTMAGDDGAGNQIGVAPGVQWIAANGCAVCSDAHLIASGQWMLAPTDTDGGNPDTGRRPHVINNSWGSRFPSTDPFMEDVLAAWADAGIFAVWANGNSGSGCATSGSPGSRTLAYSVGAYDSTNTVASFSSRGPGQDGQVKPNIAAPGVAVRSAQQAGGYGLVSGTSMAAPHVSGAVALLWAADPTLVGDVDTTRELLDLSAVDTPDDQCGGEPGDNNVYGEGRLDALALVNGGSGAGVGTLAGTVTDAATGQPVANATVSASGDIDRQTNTRADGSYTLVLTTGEYAVTVSAFGYRDAAGTALIEDDRTTNHDVGLTARESVLVSGTVTDGSGHGWPLYARIAVLGEQHPPVFTDPYTGEYQLRLPSNDSFTLLVTPQYPGYELVEQPVQTGTADLPTDIAVPVDVESCTAPGYDWAVDGVASTFDQPTVPDGWTVEDNNGNGGVWAFDDPGNRGNRTGGSGGFAIMDGDYYQPKQTRWESTLTTPVADLSDVAEPALTFDIDYTAQSRGIATGWIDLSLDGGQTWQNVWLREVGGMRGLPVRIELPQAAGQSQARIRFHYTTINTGWWQLDDVVFGLEYCAPVRGGLVAGQVTDGNTGAHLAGATVVNDTEPAQQAVSATTPNDPALADGFYWMFASTVGNHPFTAKRPAYQHRTSQVNVAPSWVTRADFTLGAGLLDIDPEQVSVTQQLGRTTPQRVTFTNRGTAPVEVELREDGGDFSILDQAAEPPVRRIAGRFTPGWDFAAKQTAAGVTARDDVDGVPAAPPWTYLANYPTPIMDNRAVTTDDGTVYSVGGTTTGGRTQNEVLAYDPDTGSWRQRAAMGSERSSPAVAYLNGKIHVVGGLWTNGQPVPALEIYNPAADSWSTGAPVPAAFAASGVGVVDGTMYVIGGCSAGSGTSCGHEDVYAYQSGTDTWQRAADYPEPVSWPSCGGIGGKLYCAGGVTAANGSTANAYVYDPDSDGWAPIADMPLDLWGAGHAAANGRLLVSGGAVRDGAAITNEGISYDPAADEWTPLPNSNEAVFRGGSACGFYKVGGSVGGFSSIPRGEVLPGYGNCGSSADLPWLAMDTTEFTLQPGQSRRITLTVDAAVPAVSQPGTYTGRITVANNSPYGVALDVAMNVTPPKQWGKLAGTVRGERCDGSTVPLPGATIAVDSWASSYTLRTDRDGGYALWLDKRNNPLSVIVALDGWRPQVRQVRIKSGMTTPADFTLVTTNICGDAGR